MSLLLLLAGCDPVSVDTYLAFVRGPESYGITPRAIPALTDARTMDGALGTVRHGGRVTGPTGAQTYTGGEPLALRYADEDGTAVPLDEDGLMLFSFYGDLADARAAVEAHGVDAEPIFPVDLAWNPAISPLLELSPVDNAAYAIGDNFFLLLPDGDHRDVPLLANAGVVTHEFGHAIFHLLQVGDPLTPPIVSDATSEAGLWQASLHEGFADAMATLLLDDADFLGASIDMPARDVTGTAVLTDDLLPSNAAATLASSALPIYDPYPLGTVFASTWWDIREGLGDADATADLLFRTVPAWGPTTSADMDGFLFLDAMVDAADADQRAVVCAAIAGRFGDFHTPGGC